MKFSAVILAAGSGVRTGLEYNKILHKINGKRVLDYSVDFFKNYGACKEIILVVSDNDYNVMFDEYSTKKCHVIVGGTSRQQSVYKGLNKATNNYVLVHDSARPFINSTKIDELCKDLIETRATTLGVYVKDTTVKTIGNRLGKALDRNNLLAIQTPQAFERDLLIKAHEKAIKTGYIATDDTDLIAKFTNVMPSYVLGDYRSVKLTTIEDIKYLEVIL